MYCRSRESHQGLPVLAAGLVVVLAAGPARAGLDPNYSQQYPTGGYGIVICGNSHVEYGIIDDTIKAMLLGAYLTLTDTLNFDPNNVWVLVDWGTNVGNWTQGLFDDLPATEAYVASTFQTIGQRMWSDPCTPDNLVVIVAGHGGDGIGSNPSSMQVQLADGMIWDDDFVSDCFNEINIGPSGSPIERLDLVLTMCFGGGLIDDFRDNFHALRGTTWPNARHVAILTGGDGFDITTGFFGLQLLRAIDGQLPMEDLNGDGVFSIFEYYRSAAFYDFTNPEPTVPPYTPYIPDTLYVASNSYWGYGGYAEHPLYYEWNAPVTLSLEFVNGGWGEVTCDPEPDDPNLMQYPAGAQVQLTATPDDGKAFVHWEIYDANHPGDANHAALDANDVLSLAMDTDRQVVAVFKCGSGAEQALPLLGISALLCGIISRRLRGRQGGSPATAERVADSPPQ